MLASSFESQSRPSYSPVPCVAQADWMYHWRERRERGRRVNG